MSTEIKELTAQIVSSYVANHSTPAGDLPALISAVYGALAEPSKVEDVVEVAKKPTAAQIRKSITPEALISFIDGRPYKMLKRHITQQGLTPASYREAYGLPANYPMTAPAYSEARSALAKSIGLGAKGRAPAAKPVAKPGRPKKSVATE